MRFVRSGEAPPPTAGPRPNPCRYYTHSRLLCQESGRAVICSHRDGERPPAFAPPAAASRGGGRVAWEGTLLLFIVFVFSLISENDLVAVACACALAVQASGSRIVLHFLERFSVPLGVIFLLIGLLLPFATGRLSLAEARGSLFSLHGLISVAVGALSAFLAAEGAGLLSEQPPVMLGLVIGSILGVALLGGLPAGPLVSAGLTALVFRILR